MSASSVGSPDPEPGRGLPDRALIGGATVSKPALNPTAVASTGMDDVHSKLGWLEPSWFTDALCREPHPTVNWFPSGSLLNRGAIAICMRCSVRTECIGFALDLPPTEDTSGIWGGTTPRQRRRLRNAWSSAAA